LTPGAMETLELLSIQLTLIAIVLVMHVYIGLHIIRRGLIFSDLALDQLAAFGTIIAVAAGMGYACVASYVFAFIAVLAGSYLLAYVKPRNERVPREAVIGIIYALAFTASLLAADKMSRGGDYVSKTLTGSMLWVTWPLVIVTCAVYIALLFFHYLRREKFLALADEKANIKNVEFWDFLFFLTQGIITVLIVPVAGVLLAYGFLMIPAAIAVMFTEGWLTGMLIGWTSGFIACLAGALTAYRFDLSYGPTLLLFLGFFFFSAMIIRGFVIWRKK